MRWQRVQVLTFMHKAIILFNRIIASCNEYKSFKMSTHTIYLFFVSGILFFLKISVKAQEVKPIRILVHSPKTKCRADAFHSTYPADSGTYLFDSSRYIEYMIKEATVQDDYSTFWWVKKTAASRRPF